MTLCLKTSRCSNICSSASKSCITRTGSLSMRGVPIIFSNPTSLRLWINFPLDLTFYSAYILKKLFIKLNFYDIDKNIDISTTFSVWSIKFTSQVIIVPASRCARVKLVYLMYQKLLIKRNFCYIEWILDWSTTFALQSIQFIILKVITQKLVLPDNCILILCISSFLPFALQQTSFLLTLPYRSLFSIPIRTFSLIFYERYCILSTTNWFSRICPYLIEKNAAKWISRNIATWSWCKQQCVNLAREVR